VKATNPKRRVRWSTARIEKFEGKIPPKPKFSNGSRSCDKKVFEVRRK